MVCAPYSLLLLAILLQRILMKRLYPILWPDFTDASAERRPTEFYL